ALFAILPALVVAMTQGGRTVAAPPDGPVRKLDASPLGGPHFPAPATALPGGGPSTAEPVGATDPATPTAASSQAPSSPSQTAAAAPAGWIDSVQHNLESQ